MSRFAGRAPGRGAPQRLVGVDVADPADQRLVEQAPLDGAAPGLHPRDDRLLVPRRLERVGAMCAIGSGMPVSSSSARATPPKVRWSTNRSSVWPSAKENRACRCFSSGASEPDEELAAHPEVHQQASGDVPVRGSEHQPEVLAARLRAGHHRLLDPRAEVGRARDVAAHDARTAELGRLDPATDDVGLQTAADSLDLRELRHTGPPGPHAYA